VRHSLNAIHRPARLTASCSFVLLVLASAHTSLTAQMPASAIPIAPGESIQSAINQWPAGTSFRLNPGTHRLSAPLTPKDGNTFIGEPGAVVSGARVLNPTWSGSSWVATGQTQQGRGHGTCRSSAPRCAYPEDLYLNDVRLTHVASAGDLGPGRWFFDYGNDRILLHDDPSGHRLETSVVAYAFGGRAVNVTIANLTIEKFANGAQSGVVQGDATRGWTVRNSTIRLSHGTGVRTGHEMTVLSNVISHNGQLGIGGTGDSVLIEGNEIAFNNTAGYEAGWEAGGSKFVETRGLVLRGNFVHHNDGPGLWLDINNTDSLYEENRTEDNVGAGIFHEISYKAVIRHNVVRRNGFGFSAWLWGAGILIAASPEVEVYENLVEGNADGIGAIQQNRGSGRYGPYEIWNLWVHDNVVLMTTGQTGLVQDVGDRSYFTSRNNRFDRNNYRTGSRGQYFGWLDGDRTDSEWRSFNNDVNGTFTNDLSPR
jgi:hypothetical protein